MSYFPSGHQGQGNRPHIIRQRQKQNKDKNYKDIDRDDPIIIMNRDAMT